MVLVGRHTGPEVALTAGYSQVVAIFGRTAPKGGKFGWKAIAECVAATTLQLCMLLKLQRVADHGSVALTGCQHQFGTGVTVRSVGQSHNKGRGSSVLTAARRLLLCQEL